MRRQQVVASAAELFDRAGYHTTSMIDVARAVGLEKPSLYHYFSGKDEILFWIHEQLIDKLESRAAARSLAGPLTASEELRGIMRDVLQLMDTNRGHVRVFFEHERELNEARRKTIRARRNLYHERVLAVVERGVRDGEFADVDSNLVTQALFGMCNWAYRWYRKNDPHSAEEIADFFHHLLINGIKRG
jgi:AcrR family transcriptional regulator